MRLLSENKYTVHLVAEISGRSAEEHERGREAEGDLSVRVYFGHTLLGE